MEHEEEAIAVESAEPGPVPGRTAARMRIAAPLALLAAGIALLVVGSNLERQHRAAQPWRDAVGTFDGTPLWQDVIPITARLLPDENFPMGAGLMAELKEAAQATGLDETLHLTKRERVVAITLPAEEWRRLTASGRPPQSGRAEVLAGALTRLDRFTVDGTTFEVVGRLHHGVSGHGLSYLIPEDAAFESVFAAENGATEGWFDPEGLARLENEEVSYEDKDLEGVAMVGGETPVPDRVTALCMAGLIAVALGGMAVQVRLLRILGRHANVLRPVSSALDAHPATLWTLHTILYGGFFGFAALAIAFPVANMGLVEFVSGIFAEGRLRHLGEAYLRGHVLEAAFWTWFNNFVVQTALLTLIPAVLVPLAGVAWAITKHLLSFCLVGFVMAPLWSNSIDVLPFHAITVTVELEAYVIAGFVATVFQLRAARAVFEGIAATVTQLRDSGTVVDWGPWRGCVDAFLVLGSGTLLVGLLLAAAGLYEAVTLILLS